MPFEDDVPPDPEIEQMQNVVCNLKLRPTNEDWHQHEVCLIIGFIFIYYLEDNKKIKIDIL